MSFHFEAFEPYTPAIHRSQPWHTETYPIEPLIYNVMLVLRSKRNTRNAVAAQTKTSVKNSGITFGCVAYTYKLWWQTAHIRLLFIINIGHHRRWIFFNVNSSGTWTCFLTAHFSIRTGFGFLFLFSHVISNYIFDCLIFSCVSHSSSTVSRNWGPWGANFFFWGGGESSAQQRTPAILNNFLAPLRRGPWGVFLTHLQVEAALVLCIVHNTHALPIIKN